MSLIRAAGVTTRSAVRALLPAQCPAAVVMPSLSATGQAPSLCHGRLRHQRNLETLKSRTFQFQNSSIFFNSLSLGLD